jgi:hypothetical protein
MLATRQLERGVPVFAGFVPATAAAYARECQRAHGVLKVAAGPLFASAAPAAVAEFGGAPQCAPEEKTP